MYPLSPNRATPPSLGSEAWRNASKYEEGGLLHSRALAFEKHIKWDRLREIAVALRGGTACQIGENYSMGHFNMVRALIFSDGTKWVARLRLPELKEFFGGREGLSAARSMESEVATMKFLRYASSASSNDVKICDQDRLKIDIPVPEVFHYDASPENEVGAPYILMSYINGNVASEQRLALKSPIGQFGTPSQDSNFRKQMARIQVELSSLKFDKIGSIYQDNDQFTIGPELQTGIGPWDNEMEYYRAVRQHLLAVATEEAEPDVKEGEAFTEVPKLFESLMEILVAEKPKEKGFRLANRDFGAHNLLVDSDFNIVGLIDFDGVLAAPFLMVAQFPKLTGLDRPIPGYLETRPAAIERLARVEPQLREYRDLVELAEANRNGGNKKGPGIAESLFSDGSFIVEGFQRFAMHSASINNRWKAAFETFLEKFFE